MQEVRVNWAFQKDQREDTTAHFHIFVGDLSSEVTDRMLLDTFQSCGGCSDARVMWDHSTGRSKGYGFVSFRCAVGCAGLQPGQPVSAVLPSAHACMQNAAQLASSAAAPV